MTRVSTGSNIHAWTRPRSAPARRAPRSSPLAAADATAGEPLDDSTIVPYRFARGPMRPALPRYGQRREADPWRARKHTVASAPPRGEGPTCADPSRSSPGARWAGTGAATSRSSKYRAALSPVGFARREWPVPSAWVQRIRPLPVINGRSSTDSSPGSAAQTAGIALTRRPAVPTRPAVLWSPSSPIICTSHV